MRPKRSPLKSVIACHCGGPPKIIACIQDKLTIGKILAHLNGASATGSADKHGKRLGPTISAIAEVNETSENLKSNI